jgi:glycine dehydrogenase
MNDTRYPLDRLEGHDEFAARHIGPRADDQRAMLATLGLSGLDEMVERAVPSAILHRAPLALQAPRTEAEVLRALAAIAAENRVVRSFIGQGYHNCFVPSVILRNVLENPAWYTAYTPYQPEISQGRLEALLNFQTMIEELTGLAIANASMLDEPTAAAEAMALAHRVTKSSSNRFFVAADCHPQTIAVVRTRALGAGIELLVGDSFRDLGAAEVFGALLQYPATSGEVHDYRALIKQLKNRGVIVAMAADLLALTLLASPGDLGADIAVGAAQRFGVPLGFGGPHAGYLAAHDDHKRAMPGRLVGVSIDATGAPALRLALQTREQHIRREKATSNICTSQVLLAVMASMYAVYHGPEGLTRIARRVHRLTAILAAGLGRLGCTLGHAAFFDTITVRTAARTDAILAAARQRGVNLRRADSGTIGIALDETATRADVEALWQVFAGAGTVSFTIDELDAVTPDRIPAALVRQSGFLAHPVFHAHRSETQMMRYLRKLADRDLALDRTMIPLGSCTMKLNAASEMLPITWPEFANIHPFAPADQAKGYARLIDELGRWLCMITGYDAISLQPNSGAQGEFAGLMAIRAWHASRGDTHRDVCLIPSSAHGTNPASAHMAGLRVVVVDCDDDGNIDIGDLDRKAKEHAAALAAIMITYPSTHGVFEARVREVCEIVHRHGGQVYLDGANMNALIGLASLPEIGADCSHLNLHKTFCIPHGGGGPGVGPLAVRAHLAPFLPDASVPPPADAPTGPVSGAPFGSASILPISWAYIAMMGEQGLARATQAAILNANYVAKRLAPHFPILYTGPNGMVAHECIIDIRPFKDTAGVTVDDVAKRLIDFGIHAPTMSFPVMGTLMIEPTESESKQTLDHFCEAMIAIREEIRAIETGKAPRDDSPLKHAPHTAEVLMAAEWKHAYSREQAAFPLPWVRAAKYWSPVGRLDHVYGDRHVVCACPPVAEYAGAV